MQTIHIRSLSNQWHIKVERWRVSHFSNPDKNIVVQQAITLAKGMFSEAKIIIHSVDGRILEERIIK
jgi:hypothetical protein